jgi:hypothetical protein
VYAAGGDPQRGLAGEWGRAGSRVVAPGTPVTAVPWPNWGFALFVTGADGGVYAAGGDPQRGLAGEWATVSEGSAPPGSLVTAVPWRPGFAVFITDPNGGIYTTTGDPQNDFAPWMFVGGIRPRPGSPVTAVQFGNKLALFATDANGIINTKVSTGGERRQLRATATINIAHGSFPDPKMVPDVLMSFNFNSATRSFTVEQGFAPITLPGSGGSINTLKIEYVRAGMNGSFGTDGQIMIPNFTIKVTASISGIPDQSGDDTFILSTGAAMSPTGRYNEMGSPADSPTDGLGNVAIVGAGQVMGIDFSIRLVGC